MREMLFMGASLIKASRHDYTAAQAVEVAKQLMEAVEESLKPPAPTEEKGQVAADEGLEGLGAG